MRPRLGWLLLAAALAALAVAAVVPIVPRTISCSEGMALTVEDDPLREPARIARVAVAERYAADLRTRRPDLGVTVEPLASTIVGGWPEEGPHPGIVAIHLADARHREAGEIEVITFFEGAQGAMYSLQTRTALRFRVSPIAALVGRDPAWVRDLRAVTDEVESAMISPCPERTRTESTGP